MEKFEDVVSFAELDCGKRLSSKNDNNFPLVILPTEQSDTTRLSNRSLSSLTSWISNNQIKIDDLLRSHYAVLFRSFEVKSAYDFDAVVKSTGLLGMAYIGGAAVRTQITERIFTANESPASENIPFHHEMSQVGCFE